MNKAPALRALRAQAPRPLGLYMMLLKSAEATAYTRASSADDSLDIATEAAADTALFLKGVRRYRDMPWERSSPHYNAVASYGRATLWHCGGQGEAVFLVPSLVNKAYILDLMPDASLTQSLMAAGYSVYMLDWGVPDGQTVLDMDTVIMGYLLPALEVVAQRHKHPPFVLGYCMGGLLALAAAAHAPQHIRALVCAATPWDFGAMPFGSMIAAARPFYEVMLNSTPLLPVDVLQTGFCMLDPFGPIRRMQAFAEENDDSQLRRMTAMEDWLADGIPLESPVARTCLFDWYADNLPHKKQWQVAGKIIDAAAIQIPTFNIVPKRDVVVPEAAAHALATALPNATTLEVNTGHIGMMVGRKANTQVFDPLIQWLSSQ